MAGNLNGTVLSEVRWGLKFRDRTENKTKGTLAPAKDPLRKQRAKKQKLNSTCYGAHSLDDSEVADQIQNCQCPQIKSKKLTPNKNCIKKLDRDVCRQNVKLSKKPFKSEENVPCFCGSSKEPKEKTNAMVKRCVLNRGDANDLSSQSEESMITNEEIQKLVVVLRNKPKMHNKDLLTKIKEFSVKITNHLFAQPSYTTSDHRCFSKALLKTLIQHHKIPTRAKNIPVSQLMEVADSCSSLTCKMLDSAVNKIISRCNFLVDNDSDSVSSINTNQEEKEIKNNETGSIATTTD